MGRSVHPGHGKGSASVYEIERQFLLAEVAPEVLRSADRVHHIRQGYLTTTPPAIRVRQFDDSFLMTVKSGGQLVRREVEFPIDPKVADALFEMAEDRLIEKRRHMVGPWEIDVFDGRHRGLLVAEVELEHASDPTPPFPEGVKVMREVTDDVSFTNQALAQLDEAAAAALIARLSEA